MLVFMFFFYGSGAHRDLHVLEHSFPTRRSSDLKTLSWLSFQPWLTSPSPLFRPYSTKPSPSRSPYRSIQSSAASMLGHRSVMVRSEEHTSELQSLMRNSYAVFCL